jgi:hypothetical protein
VDTEIEVVSDEITGVRTATVVKQRDMAKSEAISFRLDTVTLGQNQHGEDVTTCTVARIVDAEAKPRRSEAKLGDREAILLRSMQNMDQTRLQTVKPSPEALPVAAFQRADFRNELIAQSWFPDHLLLSSQDGEQKLTRSGQTFENNSLTKLKRKGFINFNRHWIWIIT